MSGVDHLFALRQRLVALVDRLHDVHDQADRSRRQDAFWARRVAGRTAALRAAIDAERPLDPLPDAPGPETILAELEAVDEVAFDLAREGHTHRYDRLDTPRGARHVVALARPRASGKPRQGGRPAAELRHHVVLPTELELPLGRRVAIDVQLQREGTARLRNRAAVTLGTSSFADGARFHWTTVATGLDRDRTTALADVLREAGDAALDVFVLPELTVPPAVRDAAITTLRRRPARLGLLVPGSFHIACPDGGIYNEAIVTDGSGNQLMRHRKLVPYGERGQPDYEDIALGHRVTLLVTPIGTVAVAICKDFFDDALASLWAFLQPEWLLVPAYGDGVPQHASAAKRSDRLSGGVVLLAHEQKDSVAAGGGFVQARDHQHPMGCCAPALAIFRFEQS